MLGVRWAGISFLALVMASCTLRVEDAAPDGGATGTTPALPVCNAESLPAGAQQAIYQKAADTLQAAGHPVDQSTWSDEARFTEFMTEVYKAAGCTPPSETAPQALHSDNGPDYYCGPGHGTAKLQHPAVSDCLNNLCKLHDACYSMCSASTAHCTWDDNTSPCDAPFLQQAGACPAEPGTTLVSGAVVFLAHALDVGFSLFSCGDMKCPALGELGTGVCSTDSSGADCTNCLKYTDRGAACLDHACSGSLADPFCYAANCPEVSECYGGYDKGVPGGFTPPTPVSNPDSVTWTLYVERGEMPETKPSGSDWDVDFLGFSPPDPYVFVTVGAVSKSTTIVQDQDFPYWHDAVLSGLAASDLRAGITFEVWDSDVLDDDYVGSCYFEMSNDTFNAEVLKASCDVDGLAVSFYTTPDVVP